MIATLLLKKRSVILLICLLPTLQLLVISGKTTSPLCPIGAYHYDNYYCHYDDAPL